MPKVARRKKVGRVPPQKKIHSPNTSQSAEEPASLESSCHDNDSNLFPETAPEPGSSHDVDLLPASPSSVSTNKPMSEDVPHVPATVSPEPLTTEAIPRLASSPVCDVSTSPAVSEEDCTICSKSSEEIPSGIPFVKTEDIQNLDSFLVQHDSVAIVPVPLEKFETPCSPCNSSSTPLVNPSFDGSQNLSESLFRDLVENEISDNSDFPVLQGIKESQYVTDSMDIDSQDHANSSNLSGVEESQQIEGDVPPSNEDATLLEQVCQNVLLFLSDDWKPIVRNGGMHVSQYTSSSVLLVQRSLFITPDGTVVPSVHGKVLPSNHSFYDSIKVGQLSSDTVKEFSQNVVSMWSLFRQMEICKGVERFESLWKTLQDGEIDNNLFQERRYTATFRPSKCNVLVPGLRVKHCSECGKLIHLLLQRSKILSSKTPPKNKGNKYLNTPQKAKRFKVQSQELRKSKRENRRLRLKFQEAVQREGVQLDDNLSDDLIETLKSKEGWDKMNPLQRLIIEQQFKAAEAKSASGMKWHPRMIQLALSICMASPKAYEELSGALRLPSRRTLFDYSHYMASQEGIHTEILSELSRQLHSKERKSYQKQHVLSFDEMYIKKNLVFSKRTGEMVGFVKLNSVEEELVAIEQMVNDEVQGSKEPTPAPLPIVDKMLCYMLNGICNEIKAVIACFGVANSTKEQTYTKTWEVIGASEMCDLQVLVAVCDGAGPNRGFVQMHKPVTITKSGTVFDTLNLFDTSRTLYFLSDPPHLLKTARNCVYSSGRVSKRSKRKGPVRLMQRNGQTISWNTVIRIYNRNKNDTIRKLFKINQEAVFLTSYSIMRVPLAAHILSRSMASYVRQAGWEDCEEFAIYCETMNDFFDMLNGNHSYHGIRTRNPLFNSYRHVNDERFKKLPSTWKYFEQWKEQVEKLPLSASEKARRIVSAETLQGIERTIKGFVGAVLVILNAADREPVQEGENTPKGGPFVNARVFSQDSLENYFSRQRHCHGQNTHPDLQQAIQGNVNMFVQSEMSFRGRKRGNVGVDKTEEPLSADFDKPLKKRPSKRRL